MSQTVAMRNKQLVTGGALLAAGLIAMPSIVSPPANASCLAFGGIINIGSGCMSGPLSLAIGLGPNVIANAGGTLVVAIANGLGNSGNDLTVADARGLLTFAYAGGANSVSLTRGLLALAVGQGDTNFVQAGGTSADIGNVALGLGGDNFVIAGDVAQNPANVSRFNIATVVGGNNNNVQAQGTGDAVTSIGGDFNSLAAADGNFNNVINVFGSNNEAITSGTGNLIANAFGNRNQLSARGTLNSALNAFGDDNRIDVSGRVNNGSNFFGDNNVVESSSPPNRFGGNGAFNSFGDHNTVRSGPGPAAFAGAFRLVDKTVERVTTGFNIRTPLNDGP